MPSENLKAVFARARKHVATIDSPTKAEIRQVYRYERDGGVLVLRCTFSDTGYPTIHFDKDRQPLVRRMRRQILSFPFFPGRQKAGCA